jgi:hypothetical protein
MLCQYAGAWRCERCARAAAKVRCVCVLGKAAELVCGANQALHMLECLWLFSKAAQRCCCCMEVGADCDKQTGSSPLYHAADCMSLQVQWGVTLKFASHPLLCCMGHATLLCCLTLCTAAAFQVLAGAAGRRDSLSFMTQANNSLKQANSSLSCTTPVAPAGHTHLHCLLNGLPMQVQWGGARCAPSRANLAVQADMFVLLLPSRPCRCSGEGRLDVRRHVQTWLCRLICLSCCCLHVPAGAVGRAGSMCAVTCKLGCAG